jgi:DNA-binding MarR family transcriptional regulator
MPDFFEIMRRAHQRSDAIFKTEVGLSTSQYSVLCAIADHPGLITADVTTASGVDRSTSSDIVIRLTERGLIRREVGDDARVKRLYLTDEGKKLHKAARVRARLAEKVVSSIAGHPIAVINQALSLIATKEAA